MYPTTDDGRIDHLHLIVTVTRVDLQRGDPISPESYLRVMGGYGALSGAAQLVRCAAHRVAIYRGPFLEQLDVLIQTSRDFWDGWQRKARREGVPECLAFFREPGVKPLPRSRRVSSWIGFAQRLIDGEQRAYEAGFSRLCQPDSAELETALETLLALQRSYQMAELALRDARKDLAEARGNADRMLRAQAATLRWLYHDPHALARAQQRYGFRRKALPVSKPGLSAPARPVVNMRAMFHFLPLAMAGLQPVAAKTARKIRASVSEPTSAHPRTHRHRTSDSRARPPTAVLTMSNTKRGAYVAG